MTSIPKLAISLVILLIASCEESVFKIVASASFNFSVKVIFDKLYLSADFLVLSDKSTTDSTNFWAALTTDINSFLSASFTDIGILMSLLLLSSKYVTLTVACFVPKDVNSSL